MTKKTIQFWFISVMIFLVVLILVGITLSVFDSTDNRKVFGTFKDLIPLAIAVPAAWLGFCFQRRAAYLKQLRSYWSKLVDGVQSAAQYTHLEYPEQKDYSAVLQKMSVAIDETRALFCNLDETDTSPGLFPFEPIKTIYELIAGLNFGDDFDTQNTAKVREQIFVLWKAVRSELLKEFDREVPTWPHTHWVNSKHATVYHQHGIPKKPS